MKIEPRYIAGKDIGEKKRTTKKSDVNFLQILEDNQDNFEVPIIEMDDISERDFQNLAALIEQFGENLAQNPTPENFNRYRNTIKLFLNLVKNNFEIVNTIARHGLTNTKLFQTVEVIDKNLSELATMLLSQEKSRLSYLKMINSIKGLIVDLLM